MRNAIRVSLFVVVCSTGLFGQAGAGSGAVSGTVKEPGGDGIPDTTVELSNAALGLRRVMTTTDDGLFTAPALNPSSGYRLRVKRKGFTAWDSGEFDVSIGQTINFEITLKREAETDSGQTDSPIPPPQVRDLKAGTASLLTQAQVDGLPAASHRVDPLVATAPLVTTDDRTGRLVFTGQPYSNVFLSDGILTTDTYFYERPRIAPQLSLDSVHELQVLTADSPSEFGYAMGGVVNAATRSGSEEYHGTAYEYLRTGGLSSAGRYTLGGRLLDRRNQFGATIGGPIQWGKVFFFANAEVEDERGTGLNRITSPVLDPSTCKATALQCAAAVKFLQGQMNVPVGLTDRATTGFAKLDYRRSDRNQFTLAANLMNAQAPNGGDAAQVAANGGLLGIRNTTDRVRYGKLGWTSAPTSNTVNELRFGLVEDRLYDPASEANLATGNVAISLAGATVGNPNPNAESLNERRYQFVDNLTAALGTHTFRAGTDLSFTRDTVSELSSAGMYLYPSLTAFAQDFTSGGRDYTSFAQEFGTGLRRVDSRMYNLYAMDTWRPVDKLTIVAGVRWDRPRRPQPVQANPSYYQTGIITTPVVDFAPRMSAALRADDRTVIRLGYGWFYAPMPGQLLDALYQGNGVTETSIAVNPNQTGAPSFPNILTTIPTAATNLMYASSKLRDPHTQQFNLVMERTLARDTTLSLSATRSRGFKLTTVNDVNLAAPTITKTYVIDNTAGVQISSYSTLLWNVRNDPNFAHIYNVLDTGSSWYSAASVELRKRMSHGLSVAASYAWSHSVDDVGGPTIDGFLPLNTTIGSVTADRAESPFDQRHRATVSWIWQPTLLPSGSPAVRHVVNGWALSSVATLASGHPVTPLVLVAGQQFSGLTMTYTNSLDGSGGWNRVPFEQFGAFQTGRQYNVDARLSRTLDFTERVKGVLLFEAFNALNTQYDTSVNAVAFTSAPTAPPSGAVTGPMSGIIRPVNGAGTGNAANAPRQAQVAFRVVF